MFTHTKEYTDYTLLKRGVPALKMGVHISFYSIKKIQSTRQLPTTPYSQVCVCVGGGGGDTLILSYIWHGPFLGVKNFGSQYYLEFSVVLYR